MRALACGALLALVRPARLDDYEGPAAQARARDLGWLAARARESWRAVEAAAAAGYTVLPLRLGTVFRSEEGVRREILARERRLVRELRRLEGKDEWAVKGYLAPPTSEECRNAGRFLGSCLPQRNFLPQRSVRAGRGLAYLLERRRRDEAARSARERLGEELSAARARLRGLAIEGRSLPLLARVVTERREEQVLNEALLLPRARAGALERARAAIGNRLARIGVSIEMHGPLPPWSFVEEARSALEASGVKR